MTLQLESAVIPVYARAPVTFVAGRGATLTDDGGRRYVDLAAGIAVANVGHAHPRVVEAIAKQAAKLIHVSNLYDTTPHQELAARLGELTDGMQSFFCNSGAESIEAAIKLVRRWAADNGRGPHIVAATNSFHGRTMGALAATGQPGKQTPFAPLVPGFVHVPFDDLGALENALDESVAAVLLEPVQGEGGVVVPSPDYLPAVEDLCRSNGALLVLDEVQTGLGRTGKWFAHHHSDVKPDVMCVAKGLAGGLPMGACLANPSVAGSFRVGDHATTFGGGPVQAAAALATLEVIRDESLVERAAELGVAIAGRLERIFPDAHVRGLGMMLAVDLGHPIAPEITQSALARGVLLNAVSDSTLRVTPPLVITNDELDFAFDVLEEVQSEIAAA